VREISRIDSGGAEESVDRPVDVRGIAEAMVESANARRRANVTFVLDGQPASAWVPGARLEQVFANLMDNAASFSPAGGSVRVAVTAAADTVVIRVCDDGPGVPAEHQGRIFDRFFSFRPGEERGVHAGLGLSIVKAVAESHGGSVNARAGEGGRGAGFEVRLPAARSARPEARAPYGSK
jgi:two-component system sensor histidine kinase ChvG